MADVKMPLRQEMLNRGLSDTLTPQDGRGLIPEPLLGGSEVKTAVQCYVTCYSKVCRVGRMIDNSSGMFGGTVEMGVPRSGKPTLVTLFPTGLISSVAPCLNFYNGTSSGCFRVSLLLDG